MGKSNQVTLTEQIYERMDEKSTEELLEIWKKTIAKNGLSLRSMSLAKFYKKGSATFLHKN